MPAAAAKVGRTFRLEPDTSEALDTFADVRFGGNKTAALAAAISIAAIVYESPHGLGGRDPSDALERWAAARRSSRPADE